LPVVRSYALLAVCPAILFGCALGIHAAARTVRARSWPAAARELHTQERARTTLLP